MNDDIRETLKRIRENNPDINRETMREWCAALRSGEYVQAKEALITFVTDVTGDELQKRVGYCCLGVATHMLESRCGTLRSFHTSVLMWYEWDDLEFPEHLRTTSTQLPDPVLKLLGLTHNDPLLMRESDGRILGAAAWNDEHGATFEQIADMIEYTYLRDDVFGDDTEEI